MAGPTALLTCRDPLRGGSFEWLLTDGVGGYSSGTITGQNTRRYHGLLIAAGEFGRFLLVSKVEDSVAVRGREYPIATNQYPGVLHPAGWVHLAEFRLDPVPVHRFVIEESVIEKAVFRARGRPGVLIAYRYLEGNVPVRISALPLLNCRDHHSETRGGMVKFDLEPHEGGRCLEVKYAVLGRSLFALASAGQFTAQPCWYENMEYARESERGLAHREDHFCPGRFEAELQRGGEWWLSFALDEPLVVSPGALQASERSRVRRVCESSGVNDEFVRRLSRAADDFVVKPPGDGGYSIIAGYPWFWEWGRDAMIALPGLLLVTRRFAEAASVLSRFAGAMRRGLLPNRILESGAGADYNTVDASLWFVYAAWKYFAYTGDADLVNALRPRVEEVIRCYREGTEYGIGVGEDGLVRAGSAGLQLTWMDAKVGDWVVTPRHGMPVEVNALWYNALRSIDDLARRLGWEHSDYDALAEKAAASFAAKFWNEECGCLYDVVGAAPDASIRPNQILAVSLPYPVLEGERAKSVVSVVQGALWTPFGLRTLAPGSPQYKGRYEGDMAARDAAYHQGTVWPWLMGPFVSAWVRVHGARRNVRRRAAVFYRGLENHLDEAGLGTVSEIFDGDPPHAARGCIAQAWSVGELLRSYVEDVLGICPRHS